METSEEKEIEIIKNDPITPAQKLIFLKYMQLNSQLITRPRNCGKLLKLVSDDYTKICGELSSEEIATLMEVWVNRVRTRFNQMVATRKTYTFSNEDVELLNLFNADKQKPNSNELSCILDHLEIAYSSPKVWLTISLEMEALGSKKDDEYWKKAFERYCNKVKRKKQILDEMDLQPSDRNSFLNTLELRVLDVTEKIEVHEGKSTECYCRVCMHGKNEVLESIYVESSDGLTIAQKISQCASVKDATKDDNLPQYICKGCIDLLENAYKFKNLCEYSDQQLRNGTKDNVEYVEYIVDDVEEICDNQVVEIVEQEGGTNDEEELSIEMNLTFENELNLKEKDIIESETSENFEEISSAEKIVKGVEDGEIHQCEICGIVCYNKITLKKHLNTHSFARPHPCEFCQKEFKTKLSLRIHLRSHTGERPYVCEVCGKSFTQDAPLAYHRAIHTGEKNFQCNLCDYRARNVNDLKIHTRKHTGARPYQCEICTAKFTTSSNLQKHLRRHTGIKNYQCSTCSRSFFSRESARKHMVIHTGLKPYGCTECSMSYGWYNGLQKHMKTQHPGVKMPTEKHFLDLLEDK